MPGKIAYIILGAGSQAQNTVDGLSGLTNTNFVDQTGTAIPVLSPGINSGATLSFAHYTIEHVSDLRPVNNFNSMGHLQSVPGFDHYRITCSGPHNIGQLVGLAGGIKVTAKLGLCGPSAAVSNAPAATPQVAFFNIGCYIERVREVVDAEGNESAELDLLSDQWDGTVSFSGSPSWPA